MSLLFNILCFHEEKKPSYFKGQIKIFENVWENFVKDMDLNKVSLIF